MRGIFSATFVPKLRLRGNSPYDTNKTISLNMATWPIMDSPSHNWVLRPRLKKNSPRRVKISTTEFYPADTSSGYKEIRE